MKLVFSYRWNHHEPVYGHLPYLRTKISLQDTSVQLERDFNKYLLSSLETDYNTHADWCDEVLDAIGQLEKRAITTYTWDGQGFQHRMHISTVAFEHTIFGECPDWPLWSCSLSQYKAALQGWRKFIDMPKSIDTKLIVDLPDDLV